MKKEKKNEYTRVFCTCYLMLRMTIFERSTAQRGTIPPRRVRHGTAQHSTARHPKALRYALLSHTQLTELSLEFIFGGFNNAVCVQTWCGVRRYPRCMIFRQMRPCTIGVSTAQHSEQHRMAQYHSIEYRTTRRGTAPNVTVRRCSVVRAQLRSAGSWYDEIS